MQDPCTLLMIIAVCIVCCTLYSSITNKNGAILIQTVILRLMGIISACVFFSLRQQLIGLIGTNGLIPVCTSLRKLKINVANKDTSVFQNTFLVNTLLSLVYEKYYSKSTSHQDRYLYTVTNIDIVLSLVTVIFPHPIIFMYLYFSYFAAKRVCGQFLNHHSDTLFLESLALSVVLATSFDTLSTSLSLCQFQLLLFRVMVGSGVVKYFGRDASWHTSFTAMRHYLLAQPFPSYVGMCLHHRLPLWAFRLMTVGMIVMEVLLPLLWLLSRTLHPFVASGYALMQLAAGVTGYHGFSGVLIALLCCSLLRDSSAVALLGEANYAAAVTMLTASGRDRSVWSVAGTAVAACVVYPALLLLTMVHTAALFKLFQRTKLFNNASNSSFENVVDGNSAAAVEVAVSEDAHWSASLIHQLLSLHTTMCSTLHIGCHYGLFAHTTRVRNELVIEVSDDAEVWQSLEPRLRPGSSYLSPKTEAPFFHLPRLDWSMWVLAQHSDSDLPRWFWVLLISVLEGNREVLRLLTDESNLEGMSFASPPSEATFDHSSSSNEKGNITSKKCVKYIRVRLYEYQCRHSDRGGGGTSTDIATPAEQVTGENDSKADQQNNRNNHGNENTSNNQHWRVKFVRGRQSAVTLEQLYGILDTLDTASNKHSANKPKVETAQEIIQRTLFKNVQKRKNHNNE